jgi:outer membrane protein TolC
MGSTSIGFAESEVALAELESDRAAYLNPTSVYLNLVPRAVKRTGDPLSEPVNDSYARIGASRVLYDFGRTRTLKSIADMGLAGRRKLLDLIRHNHKIVVLERFLDVLLADRRYEVDNEEMTLSFLHYDRLREKRELFDEISEIDLAEAESGYREHFVRRTKSELQQQYTRLQLAIALGVPDHLPHDLLDPDLSAWTSRKIPEYGTLLMATLDSNPRLLALKDELAAATQQLEHAGIDLGPRLLGGLEFTEYATVRAARDDARATVRLQIPLFNGKLKRLETQEANLELIRAELDIKSLENALREEVFRLVRDLTILRRDVDASASLEYFRDLYLDRSRTLYDLEVSTDLGDAQAKLLEANWYAMRAEFSTAITWARIDMLSGARFEYDLEP